MSNKQKTITLSFANKKQLKDIVREALEDEAGDILGENDATHITNAIVNALFQKLTNSVQQSLDIMTVSDLKQMASEKNLEIIGTGKGGRILKADYIKALEK